MTVRVKVMGRREALDAECESSVVVTVGPEPTPPDKRKVYVLLSGLERSLPIAFAGLFGHVRNRGMIVPVLASAHSFARPAELLKAALEWSNGTQIFVASGLLYDAIKRDPALMTIILEHYALQLPEADRRKLAERLTHYTEGE